MKYLLQCIAKCEQISTFLKGNSELKMSLLEEHGTFPYNLLTGLLCYYGKFADSLSVEELGRARVLAELSRQVLRGKPHLSFRD